MRGRNLRETWTLHNAELRVGRETFAEVDVEVVIERNPPHSLPARDFHGTFEFRFTPPEDIFFEDDGMPKQLDVVAETPYERIDFDYVLMTAGVGHEMDFVARSADKTEKMEKPDNQLEETLAENWPPARVLVKCETCGEVLYDTDDTWPAIAGPSYMDTLIKVLAGKHDADEGHRSIDIGIDTKPEPVREVDCTVTVNG